VVTRKKKKKSYGVAVWRTRSSIPRRRRPTRSRPASLRCDDYSDRGRAGAAHPLSREELGKSPVPEGDDRGAPTRLLNIKATEEAARLPEFLAEVVRRVAPLGGG
jgi:hypothetical protein